jgi:sugar phosphate isomerase/epimerase
MKIGIQLYNLRDKLKDESSLFAVLEKLAEYGYDGVEFCDFYNTPIVKISEKLKSLNLEAVNLHLAYSKWYERLEEEIAGAKQLALAQITFPHIPDAEKTEKGYRKLFADLKNFAAVCKKTGIGIQYHNHDFEFEKVGGKYVMDHIMETSADMLFEFDTFWAFFAGVDPAAYIKKYSGRIPMIHIKDYSELHVPPQNRPQFCAAGAGKMNNKDIINAAKAADVRWIIFEQDNSLIDPLESSRIAAKNLKAMGF